MTQHRKAAAETSLATIWAVPDAQVASGRIPGYVAALRVGGVVQVRAGGKMAVDSGSAPMGEDTLFRIASLTKPIGGALTLSLAQDGVLGLDDPVARWLPELANPRVLIDPAGPLDKTIKAHRPITVRHLLSLTAGWGAVFEESPLQKAMMERDIYPGPMGPQMSMDEFVKRVGELPLAFEPGEGWLYHTGIDVLGVLLARATGRTLSELLAERISGPLEMSSTSFGTWQIDRLATAYRPGPAGLELRDPPDGAFAGPAQFEALGSGVVSTAPDLVRFFCALADGGAPVLTADSVALMTADALSDGQRQQALPVVGPGGSWGLGTGVDVAAGEPWMAPGRWGWEGGTGTTAHVDPTRDIVGVLLTQREMAGPRDGFGDFWAAVAAAA
ncbi:MAG TPA: serine hydrolase domain-containing protein [Acidimicrobiales bacterium]|jgi:CubicO group peptidase (beta-lactamase class C family)